jgi:hypothetical protein
VVASILGCQHLRSTVLVTVLVSLAHVDFARADITYSLIDYPADENGWSIAGTITTNDNAFGNISVKGEIVSWQWTATNSILHESISASSALPNATPILFGGGLYADGTSLSIPDDGDGLTIGDILPDGEIFLQWNSMQDNNNPNLIDVSYTGQMSPEGNGVGWYTPLSLDIPLNGYQIASQPPGGSSTVPEASTLVLCSGIGAMTLLGRWRANRARPKSV